jgi:hypothetical protein
MEQASAAVRVYHAPLPEQRSDTTMAANNMQGYWTRERVAQVGAPVAMVTGVVLLILAQIVGTPRGGSGVERAVAPVAPTAAVRLITPTVAALPAEEGEALAAPAPAEAPAEAPAAEAPAAEAPAAEALPTLEPVNCAAPATPGERAACAAQLAPAPVQAAPAGVSQGGAGGGNRGGAVQPAPAPVVNDLIPVSDPQPPPAPTAGVYSCAEVTSPIVRCRGSRP